MRFFSISLIHDHVETQRLEQLVQPEIAPGQIRTAEIPNVCPRLRIQPVEATHWLNPQVDPGSWALT
jgi:hypothetical protein